MDTLTELLNKLRNQENRIVLRAVEDLRVHGWLSDGSLRNIALCNVQLQTADLMKADFTNVDFHQAHLEWADLRMADLRSAKLTRANLSGSNLSGTNLARADLYKANLRGAQNLTDEQLSNVRRLWGAIMPDGNPYDGRFNLQADLVLARWAKIDTEDVEQMADFFGVSLDTYLSGQEYTKKVSAA